MLVPPKFTRGMPRHQVTLQTAHLMYKPLIIGLYFLVNSCTIQLSTAGILNSKGLTFTQSRGSPMLKKNKQIHLHSALCISLKLPQSQIDTHDDKIIEAQNIPSK